LPKKPTPIAINDEKAARCHSTIAPTDAAQTTAEVVTMISVWMIVVLTVLNIMLRFPDIGALIESYNKF
jgi:hypothetical protein